LPLVGNEQTQAVFLLLPIDASGGIGASPRAATKLLGMRIDWIAELKRDAALGAHG